MAIRYLEFIYRFRFTWIISSILAVVTVLLLLIVLPRKYFSEAKLIVRVGRESVGLDPTATTSQTLMMQKSQEEEINSALAVLSSRKIKEIVVKTLGVETILGGHFPGEDQQAPPWLSQKLDSVIDSAGNTLLNIGVRDRVTDFERAVLKLEESTYVSAPKRTRVVSVYATSKSPDVAEAIVDLMTKEFVKLHMDVSRTPGSFEFFETEAKQTEEALEKAKQDMAEFMSKNQIVSIRANQQLLSNVWNGILSRILELENQEKNLAATLTASHPKRQEIAEQLRVTRNLLSEFGPSRSLESEEPSDANTDQADSSTDEESDLDEILTPEGKVDLEELDDLSPESAIVTKIGNLIRANSQLEFKQERVTSLESKLSLHRKKLEEARLIQGQHEKSISNVTIFQPATFNEKPVSPNKILVVAAILFFFGLSTLAFALMRVQFRPTTNLNTREIESELNAPIVAKLPYSRAGSQGTAESIEKLSPQVIDCARSLTRNYKFDGHPTGILVGVLGAEKGVGGSTVASALAACFSKNFGLKTLLIDSDTQMRSVTKRFRLNGHPGLHEHVFENAELSECISRFEPLELNLLASTNKVSNNEFRLLTNSRKILLNLNEIKKDFEIVILDLPSASEANGVLLLGQQMDELIIVGERHRKGIEKAKTVARQFENSVANVNGIVLNKWRKEFPWEKLDG